MALKDPNSFFSVAFDLIIVEEKIPYDLYVNSSVLAERERFVRIFPRNGVLTREDTKRFKNKYHQLYVLETQRDDYIKSMVKNKDIDDIVKTDVIKDSAIHHLDNLFAPGKEFSTEVLSESIAGCRESVESMIDVVKDYDVHDIRKLIGNLSFHDFYTYDHSVNVSMYCIAIFTYLRPKAKREDVVMAGLGGLLHDLGKIKIPTKIINNPGKLSDEDFAVIKKHPEWGGELMTEHQCSCPGVDFEIVRRVILEHHENVNGTGYPHKIDGKEIHLLSKITAVADFFDAITTKRSYHESLVIEDALAIMSRSVGKKIDKLVFETFTKNISKLVLKGKANKELPDDFDPCQPHSKLPLQQVKANLQQEDFLRKEKQDFGKVSVQKESLADDKKKKSA